MTIILDGTTGITTPAINSSGDLELPGGTANGVLYLNGSNVATSGSALVFDGTNLGVGVTPSAWAGGRIAIQLDGGAFLQGRTGGTLQTVLGNNYYHDGTGFKYIATGSASAIDLSAGGCAWYIAGSGSAGASVSLTQPMTLTAAGNLGIGTTSPGNFSDISFGDSILDVKGVIQVRGDATNNVAVLQFGGDTYRKASLFTPVGTDTPYLAFAIADSGSASVATERARLDASGNLGVGTTSPEAILHVAKASSGGLGAQFVLDNTAGSALNNAVEISFLTDGGASATGTRNARIRAVNQSAGDGAANLQFWTWNGAADAERARIDASGNLLVGTTADIINSNARATFVGLEGIRVQATTGSGASCIGAFATSTGATYYYVGYDLTASAIKFQVLFNGNVENTNNSYGAISDVKLKENIVDASPKLNDLMQVKVRNYNLKNDPNHKQLGVIAQELEQVFPAMIEETPDRDAKRNDLGTKTKSVKYSVFVPMLIKAMQEQQTMIEDLKAKVAALEAK